VFFYFINSLQLKNQILDELRNIDVVTPDICDSSVFMAPSFLFSLSLYFALIFGFVYMGV